MKIKAKFRIFGAVAVALLALGALPNHQALAEDAEQTLMIVALGDSLTAGFGLAPGEAFAEQLDQALKAKGHNVDVVNAGVSGDTSSGGLARLDWSVPPEADAVIIELGANDALRGIDPAITRKAIREMTKTLTGRGQAVLLAGMMAPRNLGEAYAASFDTIFKDVAEEYDTLLYPFFLEGVAADPTLNQPDGLHPNTEGVAIIVERMIPFVEDLIAEAKSSSSAN